MVKQFCDICGRETDEANKAIYYGTDLLFYDIHDRPIVDVCIKCHRTIYCCINMMKETSWKPYFQDAIGCEKTGLNSAPAKNVIDILQERTGLDLYHWGMNTLEAN